MKETESYRYTPVHRPTFAGWNLSTPGGTCPSAKHHGAQTAPRYLHQATFHAAQHQHGNAVHRHPGLSRSSGVGFCCEIDCEVVQAAGHLQVPNHRSACIFVVRRCCFPAVQIGTGQDLDRAADAVLYQLVVAVLSNNKVEGTARLSCGILAVSVNHRKSMREYDSTGRDCDCCSKFEQED